jgi:hypothetical protein
LQQPLEQVLEEVMCLNEFKGALLEIFSKGIPLYRYLRGNNFLACMYRIVVKVSSCLFCGFFCTKIF